MAKFLRISIIMMLVQGYACAHAFIGMNTTSTDGCWWSMIDPAIIVAHPTATMIGVIIIVMACTTVIIRAAIGAIFDSVEKAVAYYERDRP